MPQKPKISIFTDDVKVCMVEWTLMDIYADKKLLKLETNSFH
jgi:hypothetical protein